MAPFFEKSQQMAFWLKVKNCVTKEKRNLLLIVLVTSSHILHIKSSLSDFEPLYPLGITIRMHLWKVNGAIHRKAAS